MLLVDNIFVAFAGKVFQQTVGIPMGTNCAPLLADIFLYSYEADFIQSLLSTGKKHLASRFNLTYRYIDDVLSINNPEFENYLGQMYPAELEIKDTTESTTSASYLDLLLSIGRDGQLHTSIYDKRDVSTTNDKYCETAYSRSGVNQMWILKNSKELLDHLKSPNFNLITNIKSFDFSTLYTTIPHQKLKTRLATIIRNSFLHKNGNRRYKYLVLGREGPYFVKEHSDAKNKYTEEDIIKMLEFLVDNIFVVFAGKVFQQIVGIPMGTNCAPLLTDIFLYSYEAEFIQSLLSAGKKRLASQFNFTYRYIDDVLSINNPDFENYLGQMYSPELEIKDTTESNISASYLDLLLSIGRDGQLRTSLYDKRDDFNFHITNFPFLSSNIPSPPAYGVFISQLIRYARACSSYECFILRAMRLSNKLLGQGYVKERLKSSLRKFYGRYGDISTI